MRCLSQVIRPMLALVVMWSSAAHAVPPPSPAPCAGVMVDGVDGRGVELAWAPPPVGVVVLGYRVYRNGILLAELPPGVFLYFDPEFPVRGDAQYCVEGFNALGSSPLCCDNASATLADVPVVFGPDWYQDTFPWDETPGLPGTLDFAQQPARVASGRNIAATTFDFSRFDIPRRFASVFTGAPVTRVDLVFRIRPAPGNYAIVGDPTSGLTPLPVAPRPAPTIAQGDGSVWSYYIENNGEFGTGSPGTNGAPHHPGEPWSLRWDPNTWNSARCQQVLGPDAEYVTNYFISPGQQIIPDFLLPAGAHVEYFFRVDTGAGVVLIPDTTLVLQTDGERSIDGHRWASFSVLPDLWKATEYGGPGLARTLVVDLCDGHGAERIWTSFADSSGATAAARFGANNGWHAIGGGADVDDPANNRLQDNVSPGFTSANLGQPGSRWDLYSVQGPDDQLNGQAGSLGSRLAPRPGPGPQFGLESRQGPTMEMLRTYYRQIIILTGDRHEGILGPFVNRGQNDISILQDFLTNPAGTPRPRGLYVSGEGFVESEGAQTAPIAHRTFLSDYLGVFRRSSDYRQFSENSNPNANLLIADPAPPGLYEVRLNGDPDVLMRNPAFAEVREGAFWENSGVNGPYVASVHKSSAPLRPWVSMVEGWNIARLTNSDARRGYMDATLDLVFAGMAPLTGPDPPLGAQDGVPNAVRLSVAGSPIQGNPARIQFELPTAGEVTIEVFDTAGRRVSSLADRHYAAGRWELEWAGVDGSGRRVGPGVYFVRLKQRAGAGVGTARIVFLRQ